MSRDLNLFTDFRRAKTAFSNTSWIRYNGNDLCNTEHMKNIDNDVLQITSHLMQHRGVGSNIGVGVHPGVGPVDVGTEGPERGAER